MPRILPLLSALAVLHGCNRYELFAFTGYEQESFSARADILFVIDNSDSMQEETEGLATSFAAFIERLSQEAQDFPTEDLSDAVDFYANLAASEKGSVVNYQLGVVTTDVTNDRGRLTGSGIVTRFDPDVKNSFAANVLCDATCFANDPPPAGNADRCDDLGDRVTQAWLNCQCGANDWGVCGDATEEPLEAVYLAMCGAVENPPAACFAEGSPFRESDVGRNLGFLRDNSTFIPVIVTDEGDDSRRMGDTNEPIPDIYRTLFSQFDRRMVWTVIGPYRNPETNRFPCPTGAADWGAIRYEHFVESTNGLYVPITAEGTAGPNGTCLPRNFDDALGQLGDLLLNLNRSFRLRSVPQDGTIAVYTSDGGVVKPADLLGTSDAGVPIYGDGFSYDVQTNTVLLHGDAIPSFGEDVTVYYKPQDGNPRSLPF